MLDQVHEPIFRAMHDQNKRLDTEESLAKVFAAQGVSEDKFKQTFNSFFIDSKVRRAKALTKAYGIDGVPAIIVDGKYRTNGTLAGGQEQVMPVVDYLIDRERASVASTVKVGD